MSTCTGFQYIILATQINDYVDNYFSDYLCGFRKVHSYQHCLLVMFKKYDKKH